MKLHVWSLKYYKSFSDEHGTLLGELLYEKDTKTLAFDLVSNVDFLQEVDEDLDLIFLKLSLEGIAEEIKELKAKSVKDIENYIKIYVNSLRFVKTSPDLAEG